MAAVYEDRHHRHVKKKHLFVYLKQFPRLCTGDVQLHQHLSTVHKSFGLKVKFKSLTERHPGPLRSRIPSAPATFHLTVGNATSALVSCINKL